LSPVKHGRELHPLDSALDSKPEKETVEMSLYGPLGYVQIASDFRIVTPLQEQFDNLLLPGPYLTELFLHALHLTDAPRTDRVASRPGFEEHFLKSGLLCISWEHPHGHSTPSRRRKSMNPGIF
jgi:hypothetical protein